MKTDALNKMHPDGKVKEICVGKCYICKKDVYVDKTEFVYFDDKVVCLNHAGVEKIYNKELKNAGTIV